MNIKDTTQYQELLHFIENNAAEVLARNWANDLRKHNEEVGSLHDIIDDLEQQIENLHIELAEEDW